MRCVAPLIAVRDGSGGVRLQGSSRTGFFKPGEFPLACGTCGACLMERARQFAVRASHELEKSACACFVTLTYSERNVPYASSLVAEHLRSFVGSLRREFADRRIRFLACGEYGGRTGRPHYHAVLFGVDFSGDRYVAGRRAGMDVYRSPTLERLWPMGISEVGAATFASAAYTAKYVTKRSDREVRIAMQQEPEFLRVSLKPGIGIPWLEENYGHVYARDSVIVEGMESRPPRLYDLWLKKNHPLLYEEVKFRREEGRVSPLLDPELRDSRLAQSEEVVLAQVNRFARELDL